MLSGYNSYIDYFVNISKEIFTGIG